MGFIDWIHEPKQERWGQFVDVCNPPSISPPKFRCPYCKVTLESKEEILRHSRTNHPLDVPYLLIDGWPAKRKEVFRVSLESDKLDIENCTRIEIAIGAANLEETTQSRAKSILASQSNSLVRVRITNQRAEDKAKACREHLLDFRVAPARELDKIEQTFISLMSERPISVSAAQELWERSQQHWSNKASGEYANALANYLIGLAIKQDEADANHLEFERFNYKFQEALNVINHFNRPLARGVSAIIRFNLNDFGDWWHEAPAFPGLRSAGVFFHSPGEALASMRMKPRAALAGTAKCPVDDMTERIINATLMLLSGKASKSPLQSLLPPLMNWTPLAEYDRQKLHVLMTAMYLENGQSDHAAPHLRALRSDVNFGQWAAQYL